MMRDAFNLIPALIAGLMLGGVFFGGLWWTVRKGLASNVPALWFLISMLVRTGVTLGGFYLISRGHFERLAVCLAGFLLARILVTRCVDSCEVLRPSSIEVHRASQS